MSLSIFQTSPPLDEESIQWLFEVLGWALRNCGSDFFYRETILAEPTNEHFPGRAASPHEMAALIFARTAAYAGMGHWPLRLLPPNEPMPIGLGPVHIEGALRARSPTAEGTIHDQGAVIPVGYDLHLVSNPEALISGFAQVLAHYLGSAVREPVPGGMQNWPQTTEVLGVFLGFGLMLANTAFQFQARSCGSCGGPPAQREAFLSQYDITYAVALFSVLKGIPDRQVLRHLKSSLRGHYKRCRRDIAKRRDALAALAVTADPASSARLASVTE